MTIPNGSKLPKLIQGILYYHNPYQFLLNCRKKYGKIFRIDLPGFTPMVVVSEPRAVKQIFMENQDKLRAGEANAVYFIETFGKHSLLTLDGASHLHERKLISPPLHGKSLKNYGEKIIKITEDVLDQWPEEKIFQVAPQLQSITLQVILSVIFGMDKGKHFDELHTALIEILSLAEDPFTSFLVGIFPKLLKHYPRKVRNLLDQIHTLLSEQIRYRRQNPTNDSDVLNVLIQAKDENGAGLNDQKLREELLTLLLAGHETTATSMAWVMYNALAHAEVYKKIKSELSEVTEGKNSISIEQIQKLTYLQNVIKETLRYNPIIPFVARVLHENLNIGLYEIAKGQTLVPCVYLAGIDPDFWEHPNQFLPERFLKHESDPYHYFPFGGGIRRCIGASFAMFEMQIVLAKIFNRFDIALKSNYRARPIRRGVSFAPSGEVPIIVKVNRNA